MKEGTFTEICRRRHVDGTGARGAVDGTDVLIALGLGSFAIVLYALTAQGKPYSDGPILATLFMRGELFYPHALYLPIAHVVAAVYGFADPIRGPLLAVSVITAGLGVACTYFVCRGLDSSRTTAALACGLTAVAPSQWFLATTIEVHGLQFLGAAGYACVVLFAPWRRFWLSLAIVAACVPLLFGAHQSNLLLGAGMLALVAHASRRAGAPIPLPRLLLLVGPTLLGVFAVCFLVVNELCPDFAHLPGGYVQYVLRFFVAPSFHWLYQGLLAPLALLLIGAVIGLFDPGRGDRRSLRFVVLWMSVPLVVLMTGWAAPERGAYFQGCLPILAACTARGLRLAGGRLRGLPRPLIWSLAAALLLVQGAIAWRGIEGYGRGYDPARFQERADLIRARLGDHGSVLVGNDLLHPVTLYAPGIRELNLTVAPQWAAKAKLADDAAIEMTLVVIRDLLSKEGKVLVDLSFHAVHHEDALAYFPRLEAAIRRAFAVEELAHPHWPMLEIRGPRR